MLSSCAAGGLPKELSSICQGVGQGEGVCSTWVDGAEQEAQESRNARTGGDQALHSPAGRLAYLPSLPPKPSSTPPSHHPPAHQTAFFNTPPRTQ